MNRKRTHILSLILVFSLIFGLVFSANSRAASTYKLTKYKSYDSLINSLAKTEMGGVYYKITKMKTKYGKVKVAVVSGATGNSDTSWSAFYVKHGKKIYKFFSCKEYRYHFCSKNRQYICIYNGGNKDAKVYSYSKKKQTYVFKEKYDFHDSIEKTEAGFKKIKKKYKIQIVLPVSSFLDSFTLVPNPAFSN